VEDCKGVSDVVASKPEHLSCVCVYEYDRRNRSVPMTSPMKFGTLCATYWTGTEMQSTVSSHLYLVVYRDICICGHVHFLYILIIVIHEVHLHAYTVIHIRLCSLLDLLVSVSGPKMWPICNNFW